MSALRVTLGTGTTGYRIPSPFGSVGRRRRIPDRFRTIRWACARISREPLPHSAGRRVQGLRASPRRTASPPLVYSSRPPQWQVRLSVHRLMVPLGEPLDIQCPSTTRPYVPICGGVASRSHGESVRYRRHLAIRCCEMRFRPVPGGCSAMTSDRVRELSNLPMAVAVAQ